MSVSRLATAGHTALTALSAHTVVPPDWPEPLADAAYYGLVGDIVRALAPQSEADPAALLIQFLAAFGNVAGRAHYITRDGSNHPPQLWPVIVGATSKARKGTSWGRIRQIMREAAPEWAADRIVSGLSSGEGLVWQVRDPIRSMVKEKGTTTEEVTDPGVEDKRLLVVEGEFASVLHHFARPGNTLSPTLRSLWDSGDAQSLVKHSPGRTTGAMITVLGHITADELRRSLNRTEAANGFANRFLYVCAKRSKSLPFGGQPVDVAGFGQRVARVLGRLGGYETEGCRRTVVWTGEAMELWEAVYDKLSEGRPGLLGAVTNRGEAQTLRLALTYALTDGRLQVRREHVEAALEVWRYCEASAAYLFGGSLGDPVADEILRALKAAPDGLSRDDIRNLFSRHERSAAIETALSALMAQCAVRVEKRPTGGRPEERWCAISAKSTERSDQP